MPIPAIEAAGQYPRGKACDRPMRPSRWAAARTRNRLAGCALALLASLVASLIWPQARAADNVTFGITSPTALSLPHFIAEDRKYFAAEGLAVETIAAGSAARVLQQLAAGSLNMAQASTDETLRAILRGWPVSIIAGAAANAPFQVIAAKGIKGWSDLKGRSISVGGPTDVTLYFLRVMARENGLADQDYRLLYAGGTPDRFAQLASGAVAAAVLANPVDLVALEQGFVDLGSVAHYLPHWTQNNILINTRWAAAHHSAVLAMLRAEIRATRFFYDAANRDAVIAILAKSTGTRPSIAARGYDLYVRDEVIARDAGLSPEGIAANLDALVATGELSKAPPAEGFMDPSFLAELGRPPAK
jgi:ABC-type nitrate/sulfonate/bicarbonate transport system substrate-binding protein